MTHHYRCQRGFRIVAVLLSALATLASACGSTSTAESTPSTTEETTESSTITTEETTAEQPAPVPWEPLPADGECRSGMVLRQGDSCTHEYSCEAGFSIGASGSSPIIVEVSNVFTVNAKGEPIYGRPFDEAEQEQIGRDCPADTSFSRSATSIHRTQTINDMVFEFIAYAQSDGTFYIEEATTNDSFPSQPDTTSADDCSVGLVLSEGESCALADGGEVSVDAGKVCLGRSFCAGGNLTINELSVAKNNDGTWTIASLAS